MGHDHTPSDPDHLASCERCRITMAAFASRPRTSLYSWYSGVYFIACEPYIKIGYSDDVRRRFKGIRSATPFPVEPLGFIVCADEAEAKTVEAQIHQKFRHLLHARREWFRDDQEIRAFIATSASRWPVPKAKSGDGAAGRQSSSAASL